MRARARTDVHGPDARLGQHCGARARAPGRQRTFSIVLVNRPWVAYISLSSADALSSAAFMRLCVAASETAGAAGSVSSRPRVRARVAAREPPPTRVRTRTCARARTVGGAEGAVARGAELASELLNVGGDLGRARALALGQPVKVAPERRERRLRHGAGGGAQAMTGGDEGGEEGGDEGVEEGVEEGGEEGGD